MSFDLAQVNVSRLLAPLESPQLAPFMAALDEVNAEGDAASGFLWRLQTEDGNATAVKAFGWDVAGSHGVIVNLTTWQSVEALAGFAFSGRHLQIMQQRRQWFHQAPRPPQRPVVGAQRAPSVDRRGRGPGAATAPTRAFRRQLHVAQALPGLRAGSRGRALKRRLALPGLTGGPRPIHRSSTGKDSQRWRVALE